MLGYSENGKQIYYTQYYSTQRTKSEAECATTEEQLLTKNGTAANGKSSSGRQHCADLFQQRAP